MRNCEYLKNQNHLSVRTQVDGVTVSQYPVADPFHCTMVSVRPSILKRIRMLFGGELKIQVHVIADNCALHRFFFGVDICERCRENKLTGGRPDAPGHTVGERQICDSCFAALNETIELPTGKPPAENIQLL